MHKSKKILMLVSLLFYSCFLMSEKSVVCLGRWETHSGVDQNYWSVSEQGGLGLIPNKTYSMLNHFLADVEP